MGRLWSVVACALIAGGCFESRAVTCADGTICPPGNVCGGDQIGGCIDLALCASSGDGTACGATGACFGGTCAPAACGNGRKERDETCDDGNFRNHDGCSSTCVAETLGWTKSSATQPPTRNAVALAYDRMRGRTLMFGGYVVGGVTNETWEWDGATWMKLAPSAAPSARYLHAMAYDDVRHRVILFGGSNGTLSNFLQYDTWSWDGTTWTRVATTGPTARQFHSMAFDRALGRVLLFGGNAGGSSYYGDSWSWDGSAWVNAMPMMSPAPRSGSSMAADTSQGRLLLFGGGGLNMVYGDTWAWSGGTNWSSLMPATAPAARGGATVAIDDVTGQAMLYGGTDGGGTPIYDAWAYHAGTWSTIDSNGPMLQYPRMAYDPIREAFVLVGIIPAFSASETWLLRFEYAGESEETCVAGDDGDGDGLAGCDDPDCWASCTPFCPPGASGCAPNAPHCGDGQCNMFLETKVCPQDCP